MDSAIEDSGRNFSSPSPNCLCLGGEKTKIYTPNPRKYLNRNFLVKCSSSLQNKVRSFLRKREPKITSDWSGVVLDILLLTLQRLPVPDVLRCEAICTAWAAAVRSLRSSRLPLLRQPPWLFIDIHNSDGSRTFPISKAALKFYSLFEPRRFYTVHLRMDPPLSRCSCIGAKDGWLILVEAAGRLNILNPITGERIIDIPHPSTIDPQSSAGMLAVKAALSGSPSDGNWVIAAIFSNVTGLFYVRAGDRQWTKCESTVEQSGKVTYALSYTITRNGGHASECQIDHTTAAARSIIEMLKVYKPGQSKVTSIGNRAVLVGDNCAICISCTDFPEIKSNCIYEAMQNYRVYRHGFRQTVEIHVHDREDGSIVDACPPFPCISDSHPIWLTPSFD